MAGLPTQAAERVSAGRPIVIAEGSLLADYLTRNQLAAELKVAPRTLARWRRLREGPPRVKVGRQFLYRREAVHAWLQEKEVLS